MSNYWRKFEINRSSSLVIILVWTKLDFSKKRQKWRQILKGTFLCNKKVWNGVGINTKSVVLYFGKSSLLSFYRYTGCFTESNFWKSMVYTPCHWIGRIGYLPLFQTFCYTRKVPFRICLHFCLFLEKFNFVTTNIVIKLLDLFSWNFLQ